MRSAEDVIIEVGRSLHTGDCALVIIRKWGEELLEAVAQEISEQMQGNYVGVGKAVHKIKQQI